MKKLGILLVVTLMSLSSFSQAINDNAVIPVSVTLNSIMRLQVISGGNIEFVFSTIDSYANGISTGARYTTTFTVASSVNFDVTVNLEDATGFIGEATGTTMPLAAVTFLLAEVSGAGTSTLLHTAQAAVADADAIITAAGADNGGVAHEFTMAWECGTTSPNTMTELSRDADRYSNNVFLTLTQAP